MESNCTNCNENVYFACRKKAASYNEKLNSRESAAELLGISPSTLANHELGITKSVPVDTVVMMADLYKAPELKNMYCKKECPIGKGLPVSTNIDSGKVEPERCGVCDYCLRTKKLRHPIGILDLTAGI